MRCAQRTLATASVGFQKGKLADLLSVLMRVGRIHLRGGIDATNSKGIMMENGNRPGSNVIAENVSTNLRANRFHVCICNHDQEREAHADSYYR